MESKFLQINKAQTPTMRFPLLICLGVFILARPIWALEPSDSLSVEIDSKGVALIQARLILPAPPLSVHKVLTDYDRWPDLFPHPPSINNIVREQDQTVVDMSIPAFLLPFTLHLVTATRERSAFQIETRLMKGDFLQYEWVWRFSPTQGGKATLARMTFRVAPTIWTPDWFLRWALQTEMEGHFERIRQHLISPTEQSLR